MPPSSQHEAALSAKLDALAGRLEDVADHVSAIDRSLRGHNGHLGMTHKVDRLEQEAKRRDWWIKSIWAAFLLALFGLLLGGCNSTSVYRRTTERNPDGTVRESEMGYDKKEVDPNGVSAFAEDTGKLLQDVGASIPGWGWALSTIGGVLGGYGVRARMHRKADETWDEAQRERPTTPPQVVFMPPGVTFVPPNGTVQPPPG